MSGITAIIPNWNRKQLLLSVIARLQEQTHVPDRILVIDNGSEDGSPEAAESNGASVIRMGYNSGFAAAVNRGVSECQTEWVAVMNNDVEPERNWLQTLHQAARINPDCWFFTGKLLRHDNPEILDGAFDLVARSGCAWRAGNGRPAGPIWAQPRRISLAPFTAVLLKAELFREIGPLDERFRSYLEDVDFGIRSAVSGRSGLYVPSAVARHHGSGTLGEWSSETVRLIARNQSLLVAKHLPDTSAWPVVAGQLLWGLLALKNGRFLPFLKGKLDALRVFNDLRGSNSAEARKQAASLMKALESEIEDLQRTIGFDLYWRLYFALT